MSNRVALVTGGSRGIGRVICTELAGKGYDVVTCFSHGKDAAQETVSICREYGVRAEAYCCDVAEEADVIRLFASIKEEFGGVDVLVNNAGITRDGLILKMNQKDFSEVISTNLNGTFLCSREAAKQMLRKRSGRIINISSVVGLRGNAGQVNYASSKAGVIGLAKSLAKELGGKGITVNTVAPGFIQTDMTAELSDEMKKYWETQIPRKRAGRPEDVANAVCFLAAEESDYITGQVIAVDGGMST